MNTLNIEDKYFKLPQINRKFNFKTNIDKSTSTDVNTLSNNFEFNFCIDNTKICENKKIIFPKLNNDIAILKKKNRINNVVELSIKVDQNDDIKLKKVKLDDTVEIPIKVDQDDDIKLKKVKLNNDDKIIIFPITANNVRRIP